ncbi:hypothetical protein NN561_002183 [Cricetulus griseus]
MSFRKEDGVSSLCQKALHIITELCFAGQVEWDKCSGIFPADRSSQGGGGTGTRCPGLSRWSQLNHSAWREKSVLGLKEPAFRGRVEWALNAEKIPQLQLSDATCRALRSFRGLS